MKTKSNIFNIVTSANWIWLAGLFSIASLLGALFFQYGLGLAPCQMCYWQRHAHKAVIAIAVLGLAMKTLSKSDKWDRVIIALLAVAFVVSFGLAFWHMGVEYKWWLGPKSCSAIPGAAQINPEDILNALNGSGKMPLCSDAPWDLFGISMAGYNAILSGLAAVISIVLVFKGNTNGKSAG
jgi:disulfide bond formation protein DsbB